MVRTSGILLGFFLLGEVALRVQAFGLAGLSYAEMSSVRRVLMSEFGIEPEVRNVATVGSWGLMPNKRGWNRGAPFEVNNLGLRGVDVPLVKRPGTLRIAVLGGSLSMGAGLPLTDIWPEVLQSALRETLARGRAGGGGPLDPNGACGAYEHVEVLNLAVPNTRRCFLAQVHRALHFGPDLILWQLGEAGAEDEFARNYRQAAWQAQDHRVPILAFSLDHDRFPPEPDASNPYFELMPPLGIEYGPEHYLYPSDSHPDAEIHRRYGEAVHERLHERLPRLCELLGSSEPHYDNRYEPPASYRPWVDPDDGFWHSYVWDRVSDRVEATWRELVTLPARLREFGSR